MPRLWGTTSKGDIMAKGSRQRAVLAKRARVEARHTVEKENDKFHAASDFAITRRECLAAYEAHKAAKVLVEGGIIDRHW